MVVSFIEVPAGNLMPTDRKDTPNSPPTSLPGALGDSRSVQPLSRGVRLGFIFQADRAKLGGILSAARISRPTIEQSGKKREVGRNGCRRGPRVARSVASWVYPFDRWA